MCAFSNATTAQQVSFLACMDESKADEALSAASSCATKASLSYSAIQSCYKGGEGKALLASASKVWNKQFPERATVPHTFVADKDVQAAYTGLKAALCKAGSSAAVCGKQEAAPASCEA